MHHVAEMIRTSPQPPVLDQNALAACIEACFDCTQSCLACADACLGETQHLEMLVRCIRLNQDCADVCNAAGSILSRSAQPDATLVARQLAVCELACELCATECERHAKQHAHCRICAEVCRRCAEACRAASQQLGGAAAQQVGGSTRSAPGSH